MMMHCAATCDNDFAEHFCVMAHSLLTRHPTYCLHLVGLELSEQNQTMIRSFASAYNFNIVHHAASRDALAGLKIDGPFPLTTWCRLLLPSLLPERVKRVLYLDCDVLILGDLSELARIDLQDKAAALVPDYASKDYWRGYLATVGLPVETTYYNTGVMMMNLEFFRRHGLADTALEFALHNPERLTFLDQCALNFVLKDNIFELDGKYNFAPYSGLMEDVEPRIVHFMSVKPWQQKPPLCSILYQRERSKITSLTEDAKLQRIDADYVDSVRLKYLRRRLRFFYREKKWRHLCNDIQNYRYIERNAAVFNGTSGPVLEQV